MRSADATVPSRARSPAASVDHDCRADRVGDDRGNGVSDGPSTPQVVRISLSVAATALALYLLYLLRGVVELFVLAVFVALWLGPFVEFLTRRRAPRVVAILTAYLALLGSIVFWGLVALPPIVSQIEAGVHQLPRGITSLRENSTFRKYDDEYKITPKLESEARKLPGRLAGIAKELSAVTVGAFSAVTKLITVLALAFFLLRDGPQISRRIYRIRGPDNEARLRRVGTDIYQSFSRRSCTGVPFRSRECWSSSRS